jgi:Zn-dependent M16 (insulinase) family peptidase
MMRDHENLAAWLFIRGKAVPDKAGELLAIITDVLTSARLDNRDRIRQMALEEKAGFESSLAGRGSALAGQRLAASLNRSSWFGEQSGGISYLFFLRQMIKDIESDWPKVEAALVALRDALIDRESMVVNVTADAAIWDGFAPQLANFVASLPAAPLPAHAWPLAEPKSEGLTFPAQVNYVAKGGNLYKLGYEHSGATAVALQHLNTTYMWDKVRVQGGAYGGSAGFDPNSGNFVFTSYRDPNLLSTLAAYDGAAAYLGQGVGEQDLVRSIIGVIGQVDTYRLPDAKGYISMIWELTGNDEVNRQQRREEILNASAADFKRFADVLAALSREARVVVMGSEAAITAANAERNNFLEVTKVL